MKRMMSMVVAGLFVATTAFATTGEENPGMINEGTVVTDSIPPVTDQNQTPVDTETLPFVEDTSKEDVSKKDTSKKDQQKKVEAKKDTTNPTSKKKDTTEEKDNTLDGGF